MANPRRRRPRNLVPVALSADGLGILLAPGEDAPPSHEVRIDARLVGLLEAARDRTRRDHDGESALSPREIQALLRRGVAVAEVARRAGVPRPWVERFASPIEWERAGMAARARRAHFTRRRLGASALPLGEAVRSHLPGLSDEAFEACWDAVRSKGDEETWIVTCRLPARGGKRTLRWEYSPKRHELHALDDASARYAWPAGLTPEAPPAAARRSDSGRGSPGRGR